MLFVGFHLTLQAKKNRSSNYVNQIMQVIPDSLTYSTQNIANYINSIFYSDYEKSQAVYSWIANNIKYDINNMYSFSIERNKIKNLNEILDSRKGICHDYVLLYKNIAWKVGLKCYMVTGYTKKNGQVNSNPHAWITTLVDSTWLLSDPTWGAGYISDNTFVEDLNFKYCNVNPDRFIKSHIPFDPMWQLLNFPISKQQFKRKSTSYKGKQVFFNYTDSIQKYELSSWIEKHESVRDRIFANGISNYLDYDHLIHLQSKIIYHYQKKNEKNYYSALTNYNDGLHLLNEYIGYKNEYYLPFRSDSEIRLMIDEIEKILNVSLTHLNQMDETSSIDRLKQQLQRSVEKAITDLNKHREKLEQYLKIAKDYRESLAQSREE